jgi:hypothetical protein
MIFFFRLIDRMEDIRFGIELEMIYYQANNLIEVRNMLNSLMKKNNVDIQFQLRRYGDINYKIWKIIRDISVMQTFSKDIGFEIVSPVLKIADLSLVEQLMDALLQIPVFINITCGFHVHVSYASRRFKMDDIRKFAKTYIVFEDGIDMLHHCSRQLNHYCRPIRENTKFREKSIGKIFSIIDSQYFRYSLIKVVNPKFFFRHYKINLQNLQYLMLIKKKTIEFRQHCGTLEKGAVISWVKLLASFVANYLDIYDEELLLEISSLTASEKLERFFELYVRDDEVKEYYKKVLENSHFVN